MTEALTTISEALEEAKEAIDKVEDVTQAEISVEETAGEETSGLEELAVTSAAISLAETQAAKAELDAAITVTRIEQDVNRWRENAEGQALRILQLETELAAIRSEMMSIKTTLETPASILSIQPNTDPSTETQQPQAIVVEPMTEELPLSEEKSVEENPVVSIRRKRGRWL